MTIDYIKKILQAKVYDVAIETPIDKAKFLSQRLGNTVLLKREDLQPVFSFKLRGSYNKMSGLSESEKAKGVIAVSAGNHAQGVALSAQYLNIHSTIIMPITTPEIKVANVINFGAEVILHGDTFNEAFDHAKKISKKTGCAFIHPYDDPDVIAGQGTIGMEIHRQHADHIDAIFIPVGGGGLIAGVAMYLKHIRPDITIIGVEPDDAACLYAALKRKWRVKLDHVGLFADGVAVQKIGKEPFKIAKKYVNKVIKVTTDEICAAIKDIFVDTRSVAEPAGALSLAGLKKYSLRNDWTDKTLLSIVSGANMNFDQLRFVSERTEIGEEREVILCVTLKNEPGKFLSFCNQFSGQILTEFNYRSTGETDAQVFVGIRVKARSQDRQKIIKQLDDQGYSVIDMTDNEMAKLHVRYMVGGRSHGIEDERLFSVEFPERTDSLLDFLSRIGKRWNISLFHYRNHGDAFGRILLGIQVPESDVEKLANKMKGEGFRTEDETDNPAYHAYLK